MTRARKAAQPSAPATPKPDETFLDELRADWREFGAATIIALRTEKPAEYVRVLGSIFAKQTDQETDPLHDLTDTELVERIEEIAERIGIDIRPRAPARGAGEAGDDGASER
jgi:hypothetical protein